MEDIIKLPFGDIVSKIPEEFRSLAEQYIPELLKMGQEELVAWVTLILDGDYEAAYRAILERMDDQKAIEEGEKIEAGWKAANQQEADRRAFFKKLCLDILAALLAVAAASVTL